MRFSRLCLSILITAILSIGMLGTTHASSVKGNPNFWTALQDVVTTNEGGGNFEGKVGGIKQYFQSLNTQPGAEGISDFVVNIIAKVMIPIFVLVGIFFAILGFFKIMSSGDEKDLQKGRNYLLRGVVGTLVMVSAARVVMQLVGSDGTGGIFGSIIGQDGATVKGSQVMQQLYEKIAYPFIIVILKVIIGIMFLMAGGAVFKYLFSGDDAAKDKAIRMLVFTVVGILIIILAKTIVEAVYGSYGDVVSNNVSATGEDLGKVGQGVFEDPKFALLHTVLNRILGLTTFIITIIIIYIGYLLLVQPTDEANIKRLKTAIGRGLAGILVIGAAYLLANFFLVK